MLRRLYIIPAAVASIILLAAFAGQSGVIPIHLDVAGLVTKAIYGALTLLGGAMVWLAQQALSTLKSLDQKVTRFQTQLDGMSHELFGVHGTNGMRSRLNATVLTVQRHSEVLGVLADRAHIKYPEDK